MYLQSGLTAPKNFPAKTVFPVNAARMTGAGYAEIKTDPKKKNNIHNYPDFQSSRLRTVVPSMSVQK
jgi:hypothetical protein